MFNVKRLIAFAIVAYGVVAWAVIELALWLVSL